MSIDEAHEILEDALLDLPDGLLDELNLGILLLDEEKEHPNSQNQDLWIMGEYQRSQLGKQVIIYYGSFVRTFSHRSFEEQASELRHTLYHELTHHIEYRAGEKDLEIEDEISLMKYMKRYIP